MTLDRNPVNYFAEFERQLLEANFKTSLPMELPSPHIRQRRG
jgi:hypothetical protein